MNYAKFGGAEDVWILYSSCNSKISQTSSDDDFQENFRINSSQLITLRQN